MTENRNENQTISSLRSYFSNITVEPVLFLSQLAASLQHSTLQNLSLYKICHVKFGYSQNICSHDLNTTIEDEVQSVETSYTLYRTYLEWAPILLLTVILGAWSDLHGRKMPMLLAKSGFVVAAIIQLAVAIFNTWPAEILFISSAIQGLTGGNLVFMAAAMSYVADISSREWRTSRFAFLDASRFLAAPLGLTFAGFAYVTWGFVPVLSLVVAIRFICLLYLVWRLKRIIPRGEADENNANEETPPSTNWFKKMYHQLRDCARVCFKPRDGHRRLWLLLVLFANWTHSIPGMAEGRVSFLFFRLQYHWQQDSYAYYSAVGVVFACIGLLICLPLLSQKAKLSDPAIELIGNIASVVNPIIISFAQNIWVVLAALPLTVFYPFCFPAMRSFVSKIVSPDEYGKIFGIKAASEAIIPTFAVAAYTQLYDKTRDIFPAAFFLLTAFLSSTSIIAFTIIFLDFKRTAGYEILPQDNVKSHEEESEVPDV